MKRILCFAVGAACLSGAVMAEQGAGIGGSYQDGLFGPLLKYDWMFSTHFGLECRASYLTGSQDVEVSVKEKHYQGGVLRRTMTGTISGGEADIDAFPLELAIKMVYPLEKWTPYVLVGGGYYIYDGDINHGFDPDASLENAPGFFGAVGVELKLKENLVLFAELQYTMATKESEENYSGNRTEWRGLYSYANYDYTGTQTVEAGLDGVGGSIGLLWKF